MYRSTRFILVFLLCGSYSVVKVTDKAGDLRNFVGEIGGQILEEYAVVAQYGLIHVSVLADIVEDVIDEFFLLSGQCIGGDEDGEQSDGFSPVKSHHLTDKCGNGGVGR